MGWDGVRKDKQESCFISIRPTQKFRVIDKNDVDDPENWSCSTCYLKRLINLANTNCEGGNCDKSSFVLSNALRTSKWAHFTSTMTINLNSRFALIYENIFAAFCCELAWCCVEMKIYRWSSAAFGCGNLCCNLKYSLVLSSTNCFTSFSLMHVSS